MEPRDKGVWVEEGCPEGKTREAVRKDRTSGNHYSCVTFLKANRQQGWRTEGSGKAGCYNEEDRRTSLVFPSRGFQIVRRGEFLPTPLNQTQSPHTVSRRVTADVYLRICILAFVPMPSTTCPIGTYIMPH